MTSKAKIAIWGTRDGWPGNLVNAFGLRDVIALGWPEMGNVSTVGASLDAFRTKLGETYPGQDPDYCRNIANQFFDFVRKAQVRDLVVYACERDHRIYIGRIVGSYQFMVTPYERRPHHRAVNWLKSVPRVDFSKDALSDMDSDLSFFHANNCADEVLIALSTITRGRRDELVEYARASVPITDAELIDRIVAKRKEQRLPPLSEDELTQQVLASNHGACSMWKSVDPNEPETPGDRLEYFYIQSGKSPWTEEEHRLVATIRRQQERSKMNALSIKVADRESLIQKLMKHHAEQNETSPLSTTRTNTGRRFIPGKDWRTVTWDGEPIDLRRRERARDFLRLLFTNSATRRSKAIPAGERFPKPSSLFVAGERVVRQVAKRPGDIVNHGTTVKSELGSRIQRLYREAIGTVKAAGKNGPTRYYLRAFHDSDYT